MDSYIRPDDARQELEKIVHDSDSPQRYEHAAALFLNDCRFLQKGLGDKDFLRIYIGNPAESTLPRAALSVIEEYLVQEDGEQAYDRAHAKLEIVAGLYRRAFSEAGIMLLPEENDNGHYSNGVRHGSTGQNSKHGANGKPQVRRAGAE